jgi:SAF domain
VVATSPTPRRIRTPTWLDLRLIAGVLLVVVSLVIGLLVIIRANATRRVWAVAHDVEAGSTISAGDLVSVKIRLAQGDRLYVSAERPVAVLGKIVNRPISAGELLPRAALEAETPGMTISVPLTSDQAPTISRGARITLWVSTKTCQARVVVADAAVHEVHAAGGGSFGTSSAVNVVVRLGPDDAERVITALDLDGAVVRAGVVAGAPKQSPPQDLAGCGASS